MQLAYIRTSPDSAPQAAFSQAAGSVTLLSCIAPKLNTKVAVNTSQRVNAEGPGAAGLAMQHAKGLSGVRQDIARTRAAAVEGIKTAQREIMAACKANGVQSQEAFPATAMAPDSGAELFLGAALSLKGGGSLATAMLKGGNGISMVGDVAAGMRDKPQEYVMAAIRDTLAASSGPADPSESFGGLIVNADQTPRLENPSGINWESLFTHFEASDALSHIMNFDEHDPHPSAFPELAALNTAEYQINEAINSLEAVRHIAEQNCVDRAEDVRCSLVDQGFFGLASADPIEIPSGLADKIKGRGDEGGQPGFNREDELIRAAQAAAQLNSSPMMGAS